MRKALTLRALPLALSAALLPGGGAAAQPPAAPPPPAEMPPPPPRETPPPPPSEPPRTAANIVQIAEANAAFSTLVTAVKAADLVGPLSGPGPLTVFAPSNAAFAKLPAGTVDNLVKPANKAKLTGVLTYHVVAGAMTSADLASQIEAGGGTAKLTTMNGATLTATMDGNAVVLTDAKGGKSRVTVADVRAANGIIHAVDAVAMP